MKLYYLWYLFILDLFWSFFWSKILFFMVIPFPLLIGPSRRRPGSAGEAASDVRRRDEPGRDVMGWRERTKSRRNVWANGTWQDGTEDLRNRPFTRHILHPTSASWVSHRRRNGRRNGWRMSVTSGYFRALLSLLTSPTPFTYPSGVNDGWRSDERSDRARHERVNGEKTGAQGLIVRPLASS